MSKNWTMVDLDGEPVRLRHHESIEARTPPNFATTVSNGPRRIVGTILLMQRTGRIPRNVRDARRAIRNSHSVRDVETLGRQIYPSERSRTYAKPSSHALGPVEMPRQKPLLSLILLRSERQIFSKLANHLLRTLQNIPYPNG